MTVENSGVHEDPLAADFLATRQYSTTLCATLEIDDFGLQAMPDVSPPKWHLAHTTWFFETFLLKPFVTGYREFHSQFEYLFNSYYNGVGRQYPRPQRGLLSRPTVNEVLAYRHHVDTAMLKLLLMPNHPDRASILQRCTLGLHHEQQHQELLCTDIKYSFFHNPLYPAFGAAQGSPISPSPQALHYVTVEGASATIGYQGAAFHFDNEVPAHLYLQVGFRFANRLITNAEYMEFIQDGGYDNPLLWLADGWIWRQSCDAAHPCYWVQQDGAWFEYTLYGLSPLNPWLPVSHVNYYEADAYARWCDKRLASEQEWELACGQFTATPETRAGALHPQAAGNKAMIQQMFGELWQWTRSSYAAYPGYRAAAGAIGEYNGKFMCNQMVLRGSSCVTPPGHARPTYRNYFYPRDHWQFSGIRLADDG